MVNISGDLDARILAEADARGAEDKALSDRSASKYLTEIFCCQRTLQTTFISLFIAVELGEILYRRTSKVL